MDERDDEPVPRLRAVNPEPDPEPARETAESLLPGLPRVGALDALLRELDGLRLSLETDLALAASAVEAGAPDVASDIIDYEIAEVRAFEQRALGHLAELAAEPTAAHRWWRRIPVAPFVAAAAIVGLLVMAPHPYTSSPDVSATQASASESLAQLTMLAASGQTSEVRNAAEALHTQLQVLIERAKTDPEAAEQGLLLLIAEREVIAQSRDSHELTDVLAASNHLSNLILQAVRERTPSIRPTVPVIPTVAPTRQPTAKPSPKIKPQATPSAKPSPTSSPSVRPTTSSSPRPTTSPSHGVLPDQPESIGH